MILASALMAVTSMAHATNFDGKVFKSGDIELHFKDKQNIALVTPCHTANGAYRIDSVDQFTNKVTFSLEKYTDVTNQCQGNEVLQSQVNAALHSLVWNESFDINVDNNLDVRMTMYSENGSIQSYSMM